MTSVLDKQQFHNETGGWLGVVVLSPKGEETGVSVPPDGFIYLSEAEQRLTAAAPRNPKNNPFIPQEFETIDPETGGRKTITITPLVASADERFTPGVERPIPADLAESRGAALAAHAATTGDTVTVDDAVEKRAKEIVGDTPPATTSPRARAAAEAAEEAPPAPAPEPPAPAPAEAPVAPEETAAADEDEDTSDRPSGPLGGVEIGRSSVNRDEFTHGATGAAAEPDGTAVEGAFAPGEEVGTPDSSSGVASPPPYTGE